MTEQTSTTPAEQQEFNPVIPLALNLAEVNFVLAAIGKSPFSQVEGLVVKIRLQAQAVLDSIQKQAAEENKTEDQPQE